MIDNPNITRAINLYMHKYELTFTQAVEELLKYGLEAVGEEIPSNISYYGDKPRKIVKS